jgi:hypothetical protein
MEIKEKLLAISKALLTLDNFEEHISLSTFNGYNYLYKDYKTKIFDSYETVLNFHTKNFDKESRFLYLKNYCLVFKSTPKKEFVSTMVLNKDFYLHEKLRSKFSNSYFYSLETYNNKDSFTLSEEPYYEINEKELGKILKYANEQKGFFSFKIQENDVVYFKTKSADSKRDFEYKIQFGNISCVISEEEKNDLVNHIQNALNVTDLKFLDKLFAELVN